MDVQGGVPGSGDQDAVLRAVGEGFHARIMGGEDGLGTGGEIETRIQQLCQL